jgi:hypothetical protein
MSKYAQWLKFVLGIQKNFGLGQRLFSWNRKKAQRVLLSETTINQLRAEFAQDCDTVKRLTGLEIRSSGKSNELEKRSLSDQV